MSFDLRFTPSLFFAGALAVTGCQDGTQDPTPAQPNGSGASESGAATGTGAAAGTNPDHCRYTSRFTQLDECRAYTGPGWDSASKQADCAKQQGELVASTPCPTAMVLGQCQVDQDPSRATLTTTYATQAQSCDPLKMGCETFARGTWIPSPSCQSEGQPGQDPKQAPPGIVPAKRSCVDPLPGQPPGQSPDGKVCTWESISGSTEDGRNFEDYASCEAVRKQGRPYFPYPVPKDAEKPDPRLEDPVYVAELEWVKSQIRASSCGCCHSNKAPLGPSNWYLEQKGNFMNGFYDRGLTFGSHWVDSSAFGAYKPEENNGFERVISGFPSTDGPRMKRFFEQELAHRGLTQEDFKDEKPFGGPLHEQRYHKPEPCSEGQGIGSDGNITWSGGPARYVYVLEEGSLGPTAPPYLDLPQGTRWRIDVAPDKAPIVSGSVRYGQVPAGLTQRFPQGQQAPLPLQRGKRYYLYVTRDVIQPITRCLFVYP